ncbi:MAG TPA: hypothetical protein VE056_10780 [Pyrinomonadaceae bacterium]|nr:hypothetical protein [Pyrinomonadaceae bacterium]
MLAAIGNANVLRAAKAWDGATEVSGCGDLVKGMINLAGRCRSDFASSAVWKVCSNVGS